MMILIMMMMMMGLFLFFDGNILTFTKKKGHTNTQNCLMPMARSLKGPGRRRTRRREREKERQRGEGDLLHQQELLPVQLLHGQLQVPHPSVDELCGPAVGQEGPLRHPFHC